MTIQLSLGIRIVALEHLGKVCSKVVRDRPVLVGSIPIRGDANQRVQLYAGRTIKRAAYYFLTLTPAESLALNTSHCHVVSSHARRVSRADIPC